MKPDFYRTLKLIPNKCKYAPVSKQNISHVLYDLHSQQDLDGLEGSRSVTDGWEHMLRDINISLRRSVRGGSCMQRSGGGQRGAVSLLVSSDYCWLRSTLPAASKTLSMAQ